MRKISTNTYLDTEETLERSELWRGFVVRDAASPVFAHQIATTRLTVLLDRAARDARAGVVCVSPIDVVLDRDNAIVVQPDIVFVSRARRTIIRDRVEGAPDLVVEVISASTARRDRGAKLRLYQRYGVRECWLVTPDEWTIEVIELTPDTRHRRTYDVDTPIVSSVLGSLGFSTDDVFGEIGTGNTIEFPVG
jgi:Uma2 family endonuclease